MHNATESNSEDIAINMNFETHKEYFIFKIIFQRVFRGATIKTVFYLDKILEISAIEDIQEVLKTYHETLLGGHAGFERMKNNIRKFYNWPSLTKDVKEFTQNCSECAKAKIKRHTRMPMQITTTGEKLFDHVFVDFVGQISPPKQYGTQLHFYGDLRSDKIRSCLSHI